MRLSLATRIFVGYAVVLATFGAVSLFSISELHRNQLEIRLVSQGYLSLSQTAAAIETFQKNQARDTERLRDEDSVETRRALIRLARLYFPTLMAERLDGAIAAARHVLEFAPDTEREFIGETVSRFEELKVRFKEYDEASNAAFKVLEKENPDWGAAHERLDRLQAMEASLASSIRLVHGSIEARLLDRAKQAQERDRRTGVVIIALAVLAIATGLVSLGVTARSLRPVRRLIDGVARIRAGDYSTRLGIPGDDEIATLAREFDAMAAALKQREAELAQKQEELVRAERLAAVGKVSAQVAHEIRNPLSSIGLNVEMLEEQISQAKFPAESEAKESKELLASVTREVDRLTEITEDYLRLARLPNPALRAENVVNVLEGVLSFSREELERAKVTVERKFEAPDLEVLADEGQLRQVFVNLVRNSREAMIDGGTLTVAAQVKNGAVEVRVADTGPGLSSEARARLFEPFFSTKEGGTGLGLSLSKQIVQAHHGKLEADPSVTKGTTFVVTLPRP
jgi:signal transduction histidine kinase